jgi:hypothetical protein
MLIIALLVWRLLAFVSGYLRGKSDAADRKTEREQKKDWARRMRGRNE